MTKYRYFKIPFIIILILLYLTLFAYADNLNINDPNSILNAIQKEGASNIVRLILSKEGGWHLCFSMLNNIETGNEKWLEVAKKLRPGTDAGATFTLELSVARALPDAPEAVLSLIKDAKEFSFNDICSLPYMDGTSDEKCLEYLDKTINALSRPMTKEVEKLRAKCLSRQKKLRQHIIDNESNTAGEPDRKTQRREPL